MEAIPQAEVPTVDRVPASTLQTLFEQLDTDKNGSLDASEFRAFAMGRFNLEGPNADKIFAKYDKNHDSTLDLKEFSEIIAQISAVTRTFDAAEEKKVQSDALCIGMAYYCTFGCWVCTACTSCCWGPVCGASYASNMQDRLLTHDERLNAHISKELLSDAGMSRA